MKKPAVFVALRTFPEVLAKLRQHFDVQANDEPRDLSRDELIARAQDKQGLFITELIGTSVNMVTGDYSRGASGYWIENGALAYPVSEITIAGNLKDMFMTLEPANDLEFKSSANAPTCRIEGLTIAGT